MSTKALHALLALLSLVAIGEGIFIAHLLCTGRAGAAKTASSHDRSMTGLTAGNGQSSRLAAHAPDSRARPDESITGAPDTPPSRAHWRQLASLNDGEQAAIRVRTLTRQDKLLPGFIELFDLTSDEQASLESGLASARRECAALLQRHAVTERRADGGLEIKIAPFVEEGASLYDRLCASFQQTLGLDRYAAMLDLDPQALELSFSHFGAELRTITLERDAAGRIAVVETFERGDQRGTTRSTFGNAGQVRRHFPGLDGMIPDDI
jgi:hypothetical protein